MLDIKKIKQRFLTLNRDNLARTRESLRNRQRDFMDILPLLFHANHPTFPGFVTKNTPTGVSDYTPSKHSLKAAKKLVQSFEYKNKLLHRYDILSMFQMGSAGTIAYSDQSDFDIWLCHQPDLTDDQLAELQQKATAIEKWAVTYDLEVHFFLMEPESFKKGGYVELSTESSGSAQHHLLLEEFYRTGVLLAGRYPVWWLVPPEHEVNYEHYVKGLFKDRLINENECIDFGGIPEAPVEEFFGAALWQIYKGIDSPYKAVLKIMLMEVYANEYPNVDLLCIRYKKAIHDGVKDNTSLDPYIMLYKKIEEYLINNNDQSRLELLRRCFYFKVNEPLGAPDKPRYISWSREVMRELVDTWGWEGKYLKLLDARPTWRINRVVEERKSLVNMLTNSYQFLSNFARQNSELVKISQRDLNILGRKLYAAFERKSGKVDIINRGISENVNEGHLSFHQTGNGTQSSWVLYRGIVNVEDTGLSKALKRTRGIVELVAWCFFNNLVGERTVFALYTRDSILTLKEINNIIRGFNQQYPNAKLVSSEMNDFVESPRLVKLAYFINIGVEPLTSHSKEGKHLTSNRTDVLSYGGVLENLVLSIDQMHQTSWQEVMTFRYEGANGVIDCLGSFLQWVSTSEESQMPELNVYCYTAGRGMGIVTRMEELFRDIFIGLYRNNNSAARYVLRIERMFYVLRLEKGTMQFTHIESTKDLVKHLSQLQPSFSPVVIDRYAFPDHILQHIFRLNRSGIVQLFFEKIGNEIEFYVVDEIGSLYYQRVEDMTIMALLHKYTVFLNAVAYRQMIQTSGSTVNPVTSGANTEFYQAVTKRGRGLISVRRLVDEVDETIKYFNIQVISEVVKDDKQVFTIFVDENEFSSMEYGDQLFHEVAKYVVEKRQSGEHYPIYITDIDLPMKFLGKDSAEHVQTIHFLNYKRIIEEKLNTALAEFGDHSIARVSISQ